MRAFVVLCFVAVAVADVSELGGNGYDYSRPSGGSGGGFMSGGSGGGGFIGGGSDGSDDGFIGGGQGGSGGGFIGGGSGGFDDGVGGGSGGLFGSSGDAGAETSFEPSVAGGDTGFGPAGGFGGDSFQSSDSGPTLSKRFFTVTAQDNDDEDEGEASENSYSTAGGHKTFDVIFANNPATSSLKSALKAVSNFAGEHQTDVYVLSQQLGAKQLGAAIKASGIKPSKPKVHFIKYKTPQEAAHAQQQIRAQYDRLGGTTQDGGHESAPVQSVVGSFGGRRYGSRGNGFGFGGGRGNGFGNGGSGFGSGHSNGFGVGGGHGNGFGAGSGRVSSFGGRGSSFGGRGGGYRNYGRGSSGFGVSNSYLPPRY